MALNLVAFVIIILNIFLVELLDGRRDGTGVIDATTFRVGGFPKHRIERTKSREIGECCEYAATQAATSLNRSLRRPEHDLDALPQG